MFHPQVAWELLKAGTRYPSSIKTRLFTVPYFFLRSLNACAGGIARLMLMAAILSFKCTTGAGDVNYSCRGKGREK